MRITAGSLKGREIVSPKGDKARPTSSRLREAVFNISGSLVEEAIFLDLFAGSGIMSFEAISRGAKSATLIEQGKGQLAAIRKSVERFGIEDRVRCIRGDVEVHLKRLEESFDLIYADPPYSKGLGKKILKLVDHGNLLKKGGLFFLEEGVKLEEELTSLSLKETRKYGSTFLHLFFHKQD